MSLPLPAVPWPLLLGVAVCVALLCLLVAFLVTERSLLRRELEQERKRGVGAHPGPLDDWGPR